MVPLADGKIGAHDDTVSGVCPFIGVRVVDDFTRSGGRVAGVR
jgi:hypothetical protein